MERDEVDTPARLYMPTAKAQQGVCGECLSLTHAPNTPKIPPLRWWHVRHSLGCGFQKVKVESSEILGFGRGDFETLHYRAKLDEISDIQPEPLKVEVESVTV